MNFPGDSDAPGLTSEKQSDNYVGHGIRTSQGTQIFYGAPRQTTSPRSWVRGNEASGFPCLGHLVFVLDGSPMTQTFTGQVSRRDSIGAKSPRAGVGEGSGRGRLPGGPS